MKKVYSALGALLLIGMASGASAQRYVKEIFTDADIMVQTNVTYGTNIDFLTSNFTNQARVVADVTAIKTALFLGQPIPASHYNPLDTMTRVKVTDLRMDVYYPSAAADDSTNRPVMIYLHTGNFLPPGINGSPLGARNDSSAIYLCRQWAKRGYVAVSVSYRLGWNPIATTVQERRGTLLNAVYRAIHDVKQSVRYLRTDAAGANTWGIDPSRIVLFGEGTGAYVAMAYNTLDKYSEMELPKFINPLTSKSYIDTTTVGRIDGSGGLLNLYAPSAVSTAISATVATGGALADTSWLEAGDAPMLALQCVRDPFAPFDEGTVIVPTTLEDVVDVQGANIYVQKSIALGNHDAILNMPADAYTTAARSHYGKTYDYIYPAPRNTIKVNDNLEGLFPVVLPAGASVFQNQAGPWQWWDPMSPAASRIVAPPSTTAHMASLGSNPDMSRDKGLRYLDTIQGYIMPRIGVILGYYTTDNVSVKNIADLNTDVYPNPSTGVVNVRTRNLTLNSVEVFEITGRKVLSQSVGNLTETTIDLSHLKNGSYILQVNTTEGSSSRKIMLAH